MIDKGIRARIGKINDQDKTTTTHFLFDKSKWNLERAKKWVTDHGHTIKILMENIEIKEGDEMVGENIKDGIIEAKNFTIEIKEIDKSDEDEKAMRMYLISLIRKMILWNLAALRKRLKKANRELYFLCIIHMILMH